MWSNAGFLWSSKAGIIHLLVKVGFTQVGLSATMLLIREGILCIYTSDWTKTSCGVPQGSILGPLLFNIYMLPLDPKFATTVMRMMHKSTFDYNPLRYLSVSWINKNPEDPEFFLNLNKDKTEIRNLSSASVCDVKTYKPSQKPVSQPTITWRMFQGHTENTLYL